MAGRRTGNSPELQLAADVCVVGGVGARGGGGVGGESSLAELSPWPVRSVNLSPDR